MKKVKSALKMCLIRQFTDTQCKVKCDGKGIEKFASKGILLN